MFGIRTPGDQGKLAQKLYFTLYILQVLQQKKVLALEVRMPNPYSLYPRPYVVSALVDRGDHD